MDSNRETLELAAKDSAGNWKSWSFMWFEKPHDAGNWMLLTVEHRDSPLIHQSNARQIHQAMKSFTEGENPDCTFGRASCDLVGWREHVGVRVYKNGEITEAFKALYDLEKRVEDYPVLDESDLSDMEYGAALRGIDCSARDGCVDVSGLPKGWESSVYSWLSENNDRELEDCDGTGAYPSSEAIKEALQELKLRKEDR